MLETVGFSFDEEAVDEDPNALLDSGVETLPNPLDDAKAEKEDFEAGVEGTGVAGVGGGARTPARLSGSRGVPNVVVAGARWNVRGGTGVD